MTYHVVYTEKAIKELKKLDKFTQKIIISWIGKNLEGCENPRVHEKSLTANRKGQWRYRIGDYRLLCEIEDDKIIITVLNIGHRREVYNK